MRFFKWVLHVHRPRDISDSNKLREAEVGELWLWRQGPDPLEASRTRKKGVYRSRRRNGRKERGRNLPEKGRNERNGGGKGEWGNQDGVKGGRWGSRRLLCSNPLLRQSRNKYFRAKSAVPRCPWDAPSALLRPSGIQASWAPRPPPTQEHPAARPWSNRQWQLPPTSLKGSIAIASSWELEHHMLSQGLRKTRKT